MKSIVREMTLRRSKRHKLNKGKGLIEIQKKNDRIASEWYSMGECCKLEILYIFLIYLDPRMKGGRNGYTPK